MAGRRPKPTKLKIVAGTFRKDRGNPKEPKPPTGRMCEPDWLKGEAIWAWRQLSELLGPQGTNVLRRQDRYALMLLCDAYQEYRDARRQVQREGRMIVVSTKYGPSMSKHPLIAVAQDAWRRVRLMLVEFGLTPASVSKTSSQAADEVDPLQELLKRSGHSG